MKILCVSDQIDPLVYSSNIKQRFGDIDLVLGAGDLPMDYIDFIVSSLNKPMYFIFGNHNLKDFKYYTKNKNNYNFSDEKNMIQGSGAVHIHGKLKRESGLLIAGLGGSMRYNNSENQYTNSAMILQILKLFPAMIFNRIFRKRCIDILLTHAPPLGIHDKKDKCHQGFKCFLKFMKLFKPSYLIHGHTHLYDLSEVRTTVYCNTLVINAYSHYLLDTEKRDS